MAAMTEIQKLHRRWHDKTGEDMPTSIANLPIDRIRRAVELTEKGITVAVPRECVSVESTAGSDDSLRDWDGESNN
jgi:hypothetical protein